MGTSSLLGRQVAFLHVSVNSGRILIRLSRNQRISFQLEPTECTLEYHVPEGDAIQSDNVSLSGWVPAMYNDGGPFTRSYVNGGAAILRPSGLHRSCLRQ